MRDRQTILRHRSLHYENPQVSLLNICVEVLLDIRDLLIMNQVVFTIPSNPKRDEEIAKILSTIASNTPKKRKEG
ncbi:hypothetical protein LCGC14_0399110 [marine sediment metagenome]|uniref:Uncharacterized protein n=1 Tax=marine sediment metagenome TaxID=412755 RepID=A0A0F9SXE0_9ZZZZ|nr:hypothetical protein [Candidatus Aminicenantes bacterium]